jgi:hypothetical protein
MVPLPRNQLYILQIGEIINYFQNTMSYYFPDHLKFYSFEEEFNRLIAVLEQSIPEQEYWKQIEASRPHELNDEAFALWEEVLSKFMEWFTQKLLMTIPDLERGYGRRGFQGIYFDYDDHYLYVLDARRMVNVPYQLYYKSQSRSR